MVTSCFDRAKRRPNKLQEQPDLHTRIIRIKEGDVNRIHRQQIGAVRLRPMRNMLALAMLVAAPAAAQLDSQRVLELEAEIATLAGDDAPGVAVGIVRDGAIIYEHYAGLANLEHGIPIDRDTRFNIASNAKQFTALCLLDIASSDQLDLGEDIRVHLPELFEDFTSPISVANCINHSSGIRDVYDLWSLQGKTWWRNFFDNDDALELLAGQRDLNFEPGADHLYSNSNYILLAAMIAQATGEPFANRANALFEQLGMRSTSFLTNSMDVVPDRARPYADWNGWKEYPTITALHGDGGLYTTLPDRLAWERIIQTGTAPALDSEVITASQRPVSDSAVTEYGFGIEFGTYRGLDCISHEGSTGAYNASFIRLPTERLAVVVMSNSGGISPFDLARAYVDAALDPAVRERSPHPGRPAAIGPRPAHSEVLGLYRTDSGTLMTITERDGDLYREIPERDPVRLIHEEGNLYRYESNPDLRLAFSTDRRGQSTFTIFYPSQLPIVGVRLSEAATVTTNPADLNGRYRNDETSVEVNVEYVDEGEYSIVTSDGALTATLAAPDLLVMGPYRIRMARDELGRIQALLLDGDRIRRVKFGKLPE